MGSADILKEEVLRSKVKFDNIDTHELGIYIRKHLPKEYIESKKYGDILPKKKSGRQREEEDAKEKFKRNNFDSYEYLNTMKNLFDYDDFENYDEDEEMMYHKTALEADLSEGNVDEN